MSNSRLAIFFLKLNIVVCLVVALSVAQETSDAAFTSKFQEAEHTCGVDDSTDVLDVLIVGAGWAGMAAADHLVRSSSVSFKILESTNRTGGRTEAMAFGKKDGRKYIIERGSHWISGAGTGMAGKKNLNNNNVDQDQYPGVGTNKVMELARRIGFNVSCVKDDGESLVGLDKASIDKVYDVYGNDADPTGALRKRYDDAVKCLQGKFLQKEEGIANATIIKVMVDCGWNAQTEIEWALNVCATECSGNELERELAHAWGFDETYIWWGAEDCLTTDQNPRGYARLLDEMVADTIPRGDSRLEFNAQVVNLDYSGMSCGAREQDDDVGVVVVATKDGRSFHAREVIVTFPLGVLQRHHGTLFTPPFPDDKINVLSDGGIMMRQVTRIALQFPTVWWDDTLETWASANHGANDLASAGEFAFWRNMNHETILPGSHILYCMVGDPQSTRYEADSDEAVQAAIMRRLRSQHPNIVIPDPIDFFISRHAYDETRYGAFSVLGSKWEDEFYSTLTRPLTDSAGKPRIRFAGEAMCPVLSGYTHGALQSGIEAAAVYLYDRGLGPNPDDDDNLCLCDWD